MNISFPVYTRLNEVLFKKKTLPSALLEAKKTITLTPNEEEEIKKETVVFLRRYFSLRFECSNLLSQYDYESGEFLLSRIALCQLRYSKLTKEEITSEYRNTFARLRFSGNSKTNRDVLMEASKKPFSIPEEAKQSPFYFNSLVLERPEFLFRRFNEEYGSSKTLSRFRSMRKKPTFEYSPLDADSLTDSLEKTDGAGAYEIYKSEKNYHRDSLKQRRIYPSSYLERLGYSLLELPQVSPKVLRNGITDSFGYFPLALSLKDSYQPKLIVDYQSKAAEAAKDNLNLAQFNDVTILNCEEKYLKTYYSYDQFDIVVDFGKDTGLGLLDKKPWLLPSLTREDIENSQKRQLDSLRERSEFVKSKGSLLFINHGLLKAETSDVVHRFLERNNRFELVKEISVCPSDDHGEGGYIALISKK